MRACERRKSSPKSLLRPELFLLSFIQYHTIQEQTTSPQDIQNIHSQIRFKLQFPIFCCFYGDYDNIILLWRITWEETVNNPLYMWYTGYMIVQLQLYITHVGYWLSICALGRIQCFCIKFLHTPADPNREKRPSGLQI